MHSNACGYNLRAVLIIVLAKSLLVWILFPKVTERGLNLESAKNASFFQYSSPGFVYRLAGGHDSLNVSNGVKKCPLGNTV